MTKKKSEKKAAKKDKTDQIPMRSVEVVRESGSARAYLPDLEAIARKAREEGKDPAVACKAAIDELKPKAGGKAELDEWKRMTGAEPANIDILAGLKAISPKVRLKNLIFRQETGRDGPSDKEIIVLLTKLPPHTSQRIQTMLDAGNLREAYRDLAVLLKEGIGQGKGQNRAWREITPDWAPDELGQVILKVLAKDYPRARGIASLCSLLDRTDKTINIRLDEFRPRGLTEKVSGRGAKMTKKGMEFWESYSLDS